MARRSTARRAGGGDHPGGPRDEGQRLLEIGDTAALVRGEAGTIVTLEENAVRAVPS